jgi:hypothetical protein
MTGGVLRLLMRPMSEKEEAGSDVFFSLESGHFLYDAFGGLMGLWSVLLVGAELEGPGSEGTTGAQILCQREVVRVGRKLRLTVLHPTKDIPETSGDALSTSLPLFMFKLESDIV